MVTHCEAIFVLHLRNTCPIPEHLALWRILGGCHSQAPLPSWPWHGHCSCNRTNCVCCNISQPLPATPRNSAKRLYASIQFSHAGGANPQCDMCLRSLTVGNGVQCLPRLLDEQTPKQDVQRIVLGDLETDCGLLLRWLNCVESCASCCYHGLMPQQQCLQHRSRAGVCPEPMLHVVSSVKLADGNFQRTAGHVARSKPLLLLLLLLLVVAVVLMHPAACLFLFMQTRRSCLGGLLNGSVRSHTVSQLGSRQQVHVAAAAATQDGIRRRSSNNSRTAGKGAPSAAPKAAEAAAGVAPGRPGGKSLMIVESPTKATKIQKFLGDQYQVGAGPAASRGS